MADNFVANPGSGGTTFASDDLGTFHVPRVKVQHGADGAASDANNTTPLPVAGSAESNQMTVAGAPVTPKFAVISAASSGDNAIVASVSGKKIRVLSYSLVADAAVTAKFRHGTTDLTGAMSFGANGGISVPYSPVGHFETPVTTALQLNLGAAVGVRGHLTYIEV